MSRRWRIATRRDAAASITTMICKRRGARVCSVSLELGGGDIGGVRVELGIKAGISTNVDFEDKMGLR